jgi:hypothetical protein
MTASSNRTYYHKVQDYSLRNRKKYFKSTTVTLQGNDVRVHLCLHIVLITVNNKNNNNLFFCLKKKKYIYIYIRNSVCTPAKLPCRRVEVG